MGGLLTPQRVQELLLELAQRIDAEGIHAGIRVVGGAAVYHAQDVLSDAAVARIEHWLDARQG